MLVPRRNSFDLFDDFFKDDFFSKKQPNLMKTDIKEKNDKYIIEMDLPGYEKDNIIISLEKGYLGITAKAFKEESNEDEGKLLHQERYYGQCSRNFYVGEDLTEEDIRAEFKNGILKIEVAKKENVQETSKAKTIEIQ